jgi:small-conductance mechanosensitive channel
MRHASRWAVRLLCATAIALSLWTRASAQLDQGEPPEPPAPAAQSDEAGDAERAEELAPLVVFNREVVVFRTPFLGSQPWERAKLAARRLSELLARGGPGKVSVQDLPQGAMVALDGAHVFVVTRRDVVDPLHDTPRSVADHAATILQRVVSETREARDLRQMLFAAGQAAVATCVYALLLWGLVWLRRLIERKMVALAARQSQRLRVRGVALLSRDSAATMLGRTAALALFGLGLLLSYQWAAFLFGRFPFTRPWGEKLNVFFVDLVLHILTGIASALPGLVVALVIFWLARVVVRAVNGFFSAVQMGRLGGDWLDRDTAGPTRRLSIMVIWVFAVVIAYPYLPGAETEAFRGISVLLGLMVSLGASSIVAQAASGLILMYTRAFRTGEYVRIGEHEGTIAELGTFTTRLRTGLGEEVILPNAFVIAAATRNYSRTVKGAGFILDTTVTIGYATPWRQVEAMLLEASQRTAGILQDPLPRVFQIALSDFYVEYRLVTQAVPTEPRPRAEVLSVLHQHIQDVFFENGVQIMAPHYEMDPAEPKVVPKARWFTAPAKPPES